MIKECYLRDNIFHYNNYFISYKNKYIISESVERIVKISRKIVKVREY